MMQSFLYLILFTGLVSKSYSQFQWQNADSLFQPLPASVHVYQTTSSPDGKPNIAYFVGAARMRKHTGCREALNPDGGGSSCMLINGKAAIRPSDPEGQRVVPVVFVIRKK